MPFTEPTAVPSSPPTYSTPSDSDLAAVAATVAVVGVLMAILLTWLVLRLRRASQSQSTSIPIASRPASSASYTFRPSFAPSEASSKFGFTRKPLRLSQRHEDDSWDFADSDPFSHPKESSFDPPVSQKHRPAPLTFVPAYTPRAHRASTHKDQFSPRTPITPGTPASTDLVEPPPPAYCPDSAPWPLYQHRAP